MGRLRRGPDAALFLGREVTEVPVLLTCALLAAAAGMTLAGMLCRGGERRGTSRLSAALLVLLAVRPGGQVVLSWAGLSFRPWVGSALLALTGALAAALCLRTAAVLLRGEGRRGRKGLAVLCCRAVLVCGGLSGTAFFARNLKDEAVGEWDGQNAVMVHARFQDPYYYKYYAYHGPVVMGRLLGRSDEGWGEAYWLY